MLDIIDDTTVQSDQEIQETVAEQPTQQQQEKQQPDYSYNTKENNIASLRSEKERAERERDELARMLKEVSSKQQETTDEDIVIGPDDLAEGKHLAKLQQKIKKLEEKISTTQRQTQESSVETRIKNQYPDFDKIVSEDNLKLLVKSYPEIANTINASTDLYSKAVTAYTMITKLGIIPDTSYLHDKELAQRNSMKPKPLASVSPQQGDSPLSKANAFADGLTEDLRKQLYKEMTDAAKSY